MGGCSAISSAVQVGRVGVARHNAVMRIFRELHQNDDDPFRRQQRQDPSPTKDEGDLFSHRPSPRKIRVLLDVESLPADTALPVDLFESLIRHPRVFALAVETSTITSTDTTVPARTGFLKVHDTTADAGRFKYPGPQYNWSIKDKDVHPDRSTTEGKHGSTSPERHTCETVQSYRNLDSQHRADFRLNDAVSYAILAEVTRDAGFDILVTEAPVARCRLLPMHDRVVVLTRAETVPILAHYLRRQHIFLVGERLTMSRHTYYEEAVHSLAPALHGWEDRLAGGHGASAEARTGVRSRYRTAVSRLARALETRDDIIWSLGSHLTVPVLEDCMDDFDHLLLLLCGGVDVTARALHLALGLPPKDVQYAKLHADWYRTNVRDRYTASGEAEAIAKLDRLQTDLKVIFELRNSIHNVQIQPVLVLRSPHETHAARGEAPFRAHVTADIVANLAKKVGPDVATAWGFEPTFDGGATADVWLIADKAVETTFGFLDLLSTVVLRNPLPEGDAALLAGKVAAMPAQPVPWPGYEDHLPTLLGLPDPFPAPATVDP